LTSDEDRPEEKKSGMFGRLFGRGGRQDEAKPDAPSGEPAASETAAGEPAGAGGAVESSGGSWFQKLKSGLSKTSTQLTSGITDLFTKRRLDAATLDDLEDILIQADLGVATATRITDKLSGGWFEKGISADEVREILADEVAGVLGPVAQALEVRRDAKPHVILMVGVNGAGKTTTIGKLAAQFRDRGLRVMVAAGDTFRAAAVEQLGVWAERTGAEFVSRGVGADAAGLAFDALAQAQKDSTDVVLVDTAGRLQNKAELMDELAKIVRVMKKLDDSAPHDVILVLDATTGQNALRQVEAFREYAGVTGLIMTKLDGTARGGILVAIAEAYKLPIHAIGVGEAVGDLAAFDAREFAEAIAAD
jgi:fused signal recognition particle receptor